MIAVMGLAAIAISVRDKFKDKLYRPLRAGIFSCMELSGNQGKLGINLKISSVFLI
jgi:hypothetical protein